LRSARVERQQQAIGDAVVDDALPGPVAAPQHIGRWEGGEPVLFKPRVAVVLDDALAVGRVGEGKIEELAVALRLLEALARDGVLALRLDHGDRHTRLVLQDVVGPQRVGAAVLPAEGDDPTSARSGTAR